MTFQREAEQAKGEQMIAKLRDDFYRDGFQQVWLSIALTVAAIGLLIILSLYFFLHQVLPITFRVHEGFRVQADIPVDKPYVVTADLLQWLSTAVPEIFTIDFINYDQALQNFSRYFTATGWQKYTPVANIFINRDDIIKSKYFVSAAAAGAPIILNQGVLERKYAWWVQMPINVSYSGGEGESHTVKLIVQALVVRVPTWNNLEGIHIENMIVNRI